MTKFISFEGIEGSGKSTQAKLLHEFLLKKKYESYLTREPGGTEVAEKIREILIKEKMDGVCELLLNFAARRDHVEKLIKPKISAGNFVISDRFFDSTFAYQGFAFGVDVNIIEKIKQLTISGFSPDITFFIDIDIEIMQKRVSARLGNNKYENFPIEFHQKVREGFLFLHEKYPDRIVKIDGNQKKKEVFRSIASFMSNAKTKLN
jgi:dTMP kinase